MPWAPKCLQQSIGGVALTPVAVFVGVSGNSCKNWETLCKPAPATPAPARMEQLGPGSPSCLKQHGNRHNAGFSKYGTPDNEGP